MDNLYEAVMTLEGGDADESEQNEALQVAINSGHAWSR